MKKLLLVTYFLLAAVAGAGVASLTNPRPVAAAWMESKDVAYTSNGSSNSLEFMPTNGHTDLFIHVVAEDAGTFDVQYKDDEGNWWTIGDADNLAVTAAAAAQVFIAGSLPNKVRVRFTNTDASAGSFDVEFKEGGQF